MDYIKVKAYAKINLTLDILGVSGGYHMLDSVVASIDLYDLITVKKRKDGLINIKMHGLGSETIPTERNNAYRAARLFIEAFATCGCDITVYKNIPLGAGLGGSSADVAGVLNALAKLYEINDFAAIKKIADSIGSDCGYMLTGGYARISGRGEIVRKIDCKERFYIALLLPGGEVSTKECYALSDALERGAATSDDAERALLNGDIEGLGASLSNGLYRAAVKLNGGIEGAYNELAAFCPVGVNMTGSGCAVYAIFENDEFLRYAKSRSSGKYTFITTKTVIPKGE